jgi:pimeloyl-ACP methyl ester carboxylesterase
MRIVERLQSYNVPGEPGFDDDILEAVADAAVWQDRLSFRALAAKYDISSGPRIVRPRDDLKPLQVLELVPEQDYDESRATVCHIPYANAISDNWVMHAIRLQATKPDERMLLMTGNASSIGMQAGTLSIRQALRVGFKKDLGPTVASTQAYLQERGITDVNHVGYSFGADKAATAMSMAGGIGQRVRGGVFVEPVTAVKRGFFELSRTFGKTRSVQQRYIRESESAPYNEIWDEDNIVKMLAFAGGMARFSNIMIANALTDDHFDKRARGALDSQPDSRVQVSWGTVSELAPDEKLLPLTDNLAEDYGEDRVRRQRLNGMHHAGVDNINLFAAMIRQGLRNTVEG